MGVRKNAAEKIEIKGLLIMAALFFNPDMDKFVKIPTRGTVRNHITNKYGYYSLNNLN